MPKKHVLRGVWLQFHASVGRETYFSKRAYEVSGIDTDAMHRKFRIMVNWGLMKRIRQGQGWVYSATLLGKNAARHH